MKQGLILFGLLLSLSACGGVQKTKIKDFTQLSMKQIEAVKADLSENQVLKVAEAVAKCQIDSKNEICDKTIKQISAE